MVAFNPFLFLAQGFPSPLLAPTYRHVVLGFDNMLGQSQRSRSAWQKLKCMMEGAS